MPLSAQPLVLVLCQVQFSRVRQMSQYIPTIQEAFRRGGFPIERTSKVQKVTFEAGGGVPVQVSKRLRWDYWNRDKTWNTVVMEDSVVLQTTNYGRFEEFADKLHLAVRTVLTKSEQDRFGVVERIGLRYIDAIQPKHGKDFRFYLRPGLHGVSDETFQPEQHRIYIENAGSKMVADHSGTMVVRIAQNHQGDLLPPDLSATAPKLSRRGEPGKLVTLVDMDHYIEGNFDADADWLVARAYEMHDHIIETFHDHVVTPEAIHEWK